MIATLVFKSFCDQRIQAYHLESQQILFYYYVATILDFQCLTLLQAAYGFFQNKIKSLHSLSKYCLRTENILLRHIKSNEMQIILLS